MSSVVRLVSNHVCKINNRFDAHQVNTNDMPDAADLLAVQPITIYCSVLTKSEWT